jgi:glycosyltransferase involved in cell wall biosynthesis
LREQSALEPPDVVNVHTQCAPAWILAARSGLLRSRIVVMSYAADEVGLSIQTPRDVLRFARVAVPARSTFRFADGIWCVNRTDLAYYRDEYGVSPEKLVCLPHAVADEFYRDGAHDERNPRQLLFAGSWIQRKGVDVLVPALERLVASMPELKIVLAGTLVEESVLEAQLPATLRPHVRTFCTINDAELARLYRQSSILLLPSRREGLPIVMLEAMACGCPPLAAANSGMLDVIVPGENGWLESSFDPARWAARCLELLNAPELVERASRGARETARAFHIEAVARAARDWYLGTPEASLSKA